MTLIDTALVVFIIMAVLHSVFLLVSVIILCIVYRRINQSLKRLDDLTAKGSETIQNVHDFISKIAVRVEAIAQILSLAGLDRLYKRYKQIRKDNP